MGVPTSEVGYTSATARRGDHESSYEHVVALGKKERKKKKSIPTSQKMFRLCTAKGTNRCFMQELQETRIIIRAQSKESLNVTPYSDH